jgi:uncharacterized damage-inducible protein DinB
MSSLSQMIDAYLAGPQMVRQAVAGMSREQVRVRPVASKWSTLEVVCHLADFEPVYTDRMKRILAEDRPTLFGADEKRYAAALAYPERDLEEELTLIELTRRNMARILRTLPDEVLRRTAIHQEPSGSETRTLERYLTLITNHIPHHVKFILEKRRALGLPEPA